MSEEILIDIDSADPKSTERVAEKIGSRLKGGEVIELVGDLGSGKTTFVRGLTRGMSSSDHVASPTFTVSRVYRAGKLSLHHMDFYRLSEAGIMKHEISDIINDKNNILVIEWAQVTHDVLPNERLVIKFKTTDETKRNIIINVPKKLSYLTEELK